jgi:hypothetical protein
MKFQQGLVRDVKIDDFDLTLWWRIAGGSRDECN